MIDYPAGDLHWTRRMPDRVARGASHPCAKLSAAQIAELPALVASIGGSAAARRLGVSRVTIWRYLKRVTCNVQRETEEHDHHGRSQ